MSGDATCINEAIHGVLFSCPRIVRNLYSACMPRRIIVDVEVGRLVESM